MMLPEAIRPFVEFPSLLRAHGFRVAPDQTVGFIEAIGLLGPCGMEDIRRAAIAMLTIPKERETEFDALFRVFFYGQTLAAPAIGDHEDEVEAHEALGGEAEVLLGEEETEAGAEAAAAERLAHRRFGAAGEIDPLARFARLAPSRLPRRISYRRAPARRGDKLNLRRTLCEAVRREGEIVTLVETRRKTRQRRILLLIDVSGSMKERTEGALRFAHVLAHAAERFEALTFGTRLTCITPALRHVESDRALARVGALVADFDGGTRIGEALLAFLAIPRFAGCARGAAVVVLSDGLERGGPEAMVDAVWRLSRLAWRVDWLTPLAADAGFRPQTEALAAVLPYLDSLADGSRLEAICVHVLELARAA